jgi:hypothetical protein
MNRLARAIEASRETFAKLPPEKVASTDAILALDFQEHFDMQRLQSTAHVMGLLSADEALVMYAALGELGSADNGYWAAGVDTPTKYACTRFAELLAPDIIKAGGLAS